MTKKKTLLEKIEDTAKSASIGLEEILEKGANSFDALLKVFVDTYSDNLDELYKANMMKTLLIHVKDQESFLKYLSSKTGLHYKKIGVYMTKMFVEILDKENTNISEGENFKNMKMLLSMAYLSKTTEASLPSVELNNNEKYTTEISGDIDYDSSGSDIE